MNEAYELREYKLSFLLIKTSPTSFAQNYCFSIDIDKTKSDFRFNSVVVLILTEIECEFLTN